MNFLAPKLAFTLGHGLITSALIVLTFYFIGDEKPNKFGLLIRYCFMALVLFATSIVSGLLVK